MKFAGKVVRYEQDGTYGVTLEVKLQAPNVPVKPPENLEGPKRRQAFAKYKAELELFEAEHAKAVGRALVGRSMSLDL